MSFFGDGYTWGCGQYDTYGPWPGPVDKWACSPASAPHPPPFIPAVDSFTQTAIFPVVAGAPVMSTTTNFALIASHGIKSNQQLITAIVPIGTTTAVSGIKVTITLTGIRGYVPETLSMRVVAEGRLTGLLTPSFKVYETTTGTPITTQTFQMTINFVTDTWDISNTTGITKFTVYLYSS